MLKGLRTGWRAVGLLTFNTLVFALAANLVAFLILALTPQGLGPEVDTEALLEAYPGFSEAEIHRIQSETWGRDYVYEPFTQFKEGEVHGDFVTVNDTGFRQAPGRAPWPPDPAATNVFVFGGSTTFGYGLEDNDTIPVALERHLRGSGCADVVVYNLARSNYFSTQERILFEQLLLQDILPSVSVFIDGLNEFINANGEPKYSGRLAYLMAETRGQLALRALRQTALARLLRRFVTREPSPPATGSESDREAAAQAVLRRWRGNQEMIRAVAETRGVSTLFVWQPVPFFPAETNGNPFLRGDAPPVPNAALLETGYQLLAMQKRPSGTLWLANLGPRAKEPSYVDRVHYSAAFSSLIASRIATALAPELCSGAHGS